MSRQGRLIGVLAALAVVGMGLALYLVLGVADGPSTAPDAEEVAAAPDAPPDAPADAGGARRRAQHLGDCAIFGQVRRAEGGASVVLQDVVLIDATGAATHTVTDEAGAFRFAGVAPGGPYEVNVTAAGFAAVRLPGIALDRREERDVGTLFLDAAVPVAVHVRNLADEPVADAEVHAYTAPQRSWNFDWTKALAQIGQAPIAVVSLRTDASGIAQFDGLAAGTWTFVAVKPGFSRSGKASVQLRAREAAEPITLYLGAGHVVAGRVLDDGGDPIAGALVLGSLDNNQWDVSAAPLRARATADAEGHYVLESLPAGDVSLWAGRAGDVPRMVVVVRVPDVDGIDLTLRAGGTLIGVVTEEGSGEPIAGATVRLWTGEGAAAAETDAEGRYTVQAPGAGQVPSVVVAKEGYYQVVPDGPQAPLTVRRGETVEHDVELAPGATVTGTISGPKGPVAGANVMVVRVTAGRGFDQRQATADAQGVYRVKGLEAGTAYVIVSAPGLYTPGFADNWWMALQSGTAPEETKVEIEKGAEAHHDVVLAAGGVVMGRVETVEGEPVEGARVSAWSTTGWSRDTPEGVLSGADGSFRLEGVLPAAQLALRVSRTGLVATGGETLAMAEGETKEGVVVRMAAPPVVRGTVRLDGGALPADTRVQVTVFPEQTNGPSFVDPALYANNAARYPVHADGTYEVVLAGVAGRFVVSAEAPGHPSVSAEAQSFDAARHEYTVDVALGVGVGIEGRVVDKATRQGLGGARVRISPAQNDGSGNSRARMTAMAFARRTGGSGGAVVAVTDSTGAFRVGGLAEGDYQVMAEAEDHVSGSAEAHAPSAVPVEVALAPELSIRGVVVRPDGTPVPGVAVGAAPADGPDPGMQPAMPFGQGGTVTDASGAFEVPGLAEGLFRMSVSNPWQGKANILPYDGPPVAAGTSDARLVVREGMRIAGRVADEAGKPVAGAWIWAMPEKPQPGTSMTNSNTQSAADGTFEIVGLAPGESTYRVQVQSNTGFGGRSSTPAVLTGIKPGTTGLSVVLATGLSIDGVVVDESGAPVSNGFISASPVRTDGDGPHTGASTQLGGDGRFKIGGLAAGTYRLEMQSWGGRGSTRLQLSGGEEVSAGASGLHLTATKGGVIAGTVVDESGAPVPGARVDAHGASGRSSGASTGPDGAFELSGLDANGTYAVSVRAQGKLGGREAEVAVGSLALRLVVRDGVDCTGRAVAADGSPLGGVSLSFQPQGRQDATAQSGTTEEDGSFRIGGFVRGVEYRVQAVVRKERSMRWVDLGTISGGASGVTLQAPGE